MPLIVETIVTTMNANGRGAYRAARPDRGGRELGHRAVPPSRTLDNLREVPFAVAIHTDDVRVFAGCVTGRKSWPTRGRPTRSTAPCWTSAVSHWELAVESVTEDELRPRFSCRSCMRRATAPWGVSTARKPRCSSARCWSRA